MSVKKYHEHFKAIIANDNDFLPQIDLCRQKNLPLIKSLEDLETILITEPFTDLYILRLRTCTTKQNMLFKCMCEYLNFRYCYIDQELNKGLFIYAPNDTYTLTQDQTLQVYKSNYNFVKFLVQCVNNDGKNHPIVFFGKMTFTVNNIWIDCFILFGICNQGNARIFFNTDETTMIDWFYETLKCFNYVKPFVIYCSLHKSLDKVVKHWFQIIIGRSTTNQYLDPFFFKKTLQDLAIKNNVFDAESLRICLYLKIKSEFVEKCIKKYLEKVDKIFKRNGFMKFSDENSKMVT